jgi:hypothetical protein
VYRSPANLFSPLSNLSSRLLFDTTAPGSLESAWLILNRGMDLHLDALARDLSALTRRFTDLGARLGDAAQALAESGAPPPDGLLEDLAGARTEFMQLRTDVINAAEAASVPPSAEPESLTDLEPLLEAIAAAIEAQAKRARLEETRDRLVGTLDMVLDLVHRDDPQFAALAGCHTRARELREMAMALTDPDAPEAAELGTLGQCFLDLLTMLETREGLDDERYGQLEESVSRAFGRSLAVAAARGRLGLASEIALEAPPEPPAPEPLSVPPPELEPPGPEPVALAPTPTIEMPPLELEPPGPEPVAVTPIPATDMPPAPVAPPVVSEPEEPAEPDETAQWWLAAWARWSGWKASHEFADVVREEIGKYPYLLSVPIQRSPEYEDGLLAYGYSILMDHLEKQSPGSVGAALNSLRPGERRPVGEQLYDYLVAQGRLAETYADFVRNALVAAVPEPGLWFQFRILESKDDTRIFQRPTARLGESELSGQRLTSEGQRYAEHKFKMTLAPLTTRCVLVSADIPRDTRGLGVHLVVDGQPSDSGWMVTVANTTRARTEARRIVADGTHVQGLGKDFGAVWIAVFNPDPTTDRRYELSVLLRKDARSPFRAKA